MEAESDELEENVSVIRNIVIIERRRLIGYDRSVLCCEAGEIFGANCRLDEDYDSVLGVKDVVETIDVDEHRASVLCLGGIEDVSIWTKTQSWRICSVGFRSESLYRSCVVIFYPRRDVAGAGEIIVSILCIGLLHYAEPEECSGTGH